MWTAAGGAAEGLRRSQDPGDPVTGLLHPLFDLPVVHRLGVEDCQKALFPVGAAGRAGWKKGLLTVLSSPPGDDGQIKPRGEQAGYRNTGVL